MTSAAGHSNKATGKMREGLSTIRQINDSVKLLSLNARIEAARAGASGKTFAVVAEEMKTLSDRVQSIAEKLDSEITETEKEISAADARARGNRLSDLAFNAIEILDRNLYERTADVRWWATEAAFVEACRAPADEARSRAAGGRMGIILKNYTIYKELILADLQGRVIASGRPDKYRLHNTDVSGRKWFEGARATSNGHEYFVQDVEACQLTGDFAVIYSAAVREGGEANGKAIGVLAVIFDWAQANYIVKNVKLPEEEKTDARVVLFNSGGYVIASSDGNGILAENLAGLEGVRRALKGEKGFAHETVNGSKALVAFAGTPGYETYRGLGWGCAIIRPV